MRYRDLVSESIVGSEQNVRDMIQTIIMSLSAQGVDDIPTEKIARILKRRMKLDVPYGKIIDILNTMPIVDNSTDEQIQLKDDSDVNSTEENAKDKVAQMASKGTPADNSF